MDWKYILSLNPEDLEDDDKDEIYNIVTWFDCDGSEMNMKKCVALIKVSQEILKYKGEQVETLLHELDELAIKQAEEESRKAESENEAKSSKSKRSGSIELENMEQKYIELKAKYKKVIKTNEINSIELEKLNQKLKKIETENKHLQNEIRAKVQEGSESDISETIKDQQKELVNTIHNKNQQISELLQDMEEVEKENFIFRDKFSNIREELSSTTKEMESLTEKLRSNDLVLKENEEIIKKLTAQNDLLQEELEETKKQKDTMEKEMEDFSDEVNTRIDEWKKILDKKNAEIEKLQSLSHTHTYRTISPESSSIDENVERSHIIALNQLLTQREKQFLELQTQLQIATTEMEESTVVIQKLKFEKEANEKSISELKEALKDAQKQLKFSNERGQKLQEEVNYLRKLSDGKDADLVKIIKELKENGEIDAAECLKQMQLLKSDKRLMENQIGSLVKATNSLQENCTILEKENFLLREKLGIPEDEVLIASEFDLKKKRQKKELEALKKRLRNMEEEQVEAKMEAQRLNRIISTLSNQIIELGQKPKCDQQQEKFSDFGVDSRIRKEIKQLSEENEALRKGMHEILNSINVKANSSTKEIKSETLEKLLRALDVKHISGWYHPAMRLQAELHNAEGINKELREQLRETKLELQQVRDTPRQDSQQDDSCNKEDKIVETIESIPIHSLEESFEIGEIKLDGTQQYEFISKDLKTIENIYKLMEILVSSVANSEKIGQCNFALLRNGLNNLQQLIYVLNEEFLEDKNNTSLELSQYCEKISNIQDKLEISDSKLKIYEESDSDESRNRKIEEIVEKNVSLQRKVNFLQNEINQLKEKLETTKKNMSKTENASSTTISELCNKITILGDKLEIAENQLRSSVAFQIHRNVHNELDNTTIKYRKLIETMKQQSDNKSKEIEVLTETKKDLENDKRVLIEKLTDALKKFQVQNFQNVDENLVKIAEKLSESQVNELSEKQRANHTNNLYELVKEQLNKSEEKFKEFTKFNEDLLHKNLTLQEQLKSAEDKLCNYVDKELFDSQINLKNEIIKENSELKTEFTNLRAELGSLKSNLGDSQQWNSAKEQELLNLKHQIVDLIADSDEKMLISQLNSDVLNLRQKENELNRNLEKVNDRVTTLVREKEVIQRKLEQREKEFDALETEMTKKINCLRELLAKQKHQYLGCVPLCSEESFLENLKRINQEKHETFMTLLDTKNLENDITLLKEQCEVELKSASKQKHLFTSGNKDQFGNLTSWLQEKKNLQINELRFRRQAEFKETQIQHLLERIKIQDEQIGKLDEEMLLWHKNFDFNETTISTPVKQKQLTKEMVLHESVSPEPQGPSLIIMKNQETQTETQNVPSTSESTEILFLRSENAKLATEILLKDQTITNLKKTITELEMNISLFRKQLGDKQSQITFYEKHILELQNKKQEHLPGNGDGDNVNVGAHSEAVTLKNNLVAIQEQLKIKEHEIIRYQTLLKEDRDEHSLAAARLQEELQTLHKCLSEEKQKCEMLELSLNQQKPKLAAIEQYITQVHALEKHTAELHTNITSLEAHLQSCREESVRWRSLANDRLEAMEQLRKSLDEQHKNELLLYKTDSEKIKELSKDEVNTLKQLVSQSKSEPTGKIDSDVLRLFKEKDDRIVDLTSKLRLAKAELRRGVQDREEDAASKLLDSEAARSNLLKEHELLRKRHEQLVNKERAARDEIRELKAQLLKKTSVPVRLDKSEKSLKEQLQKKISTLENEIEELTKRLSEQTTLNESHRLKTAEDFDKWKKMKQFQQNSEKLKTKLKEKDEAVQKLQQTCSGYRMLIEKLEREKHNLENRIKVLKSGITNVGSVKEIEILKLENAKLYSEIDVLNSKLEMQQHHAGGLGAAMLQEKLESQERKIAILEVTAKGTAETRAEMERLHAAVSNLQKSNLRLEAENLELKMDLEKSSKEIPHFLEQIQHLENYVDVLKRENSKQQLKKTEDSDATCTTPETKKVSELERTVFILKRVVEKLQAENKRLLSGKRPLSDRATSSDKLQRDHHRLKEKYTESIQKVEKMEAELAAANSKVKAFSAKPQNDKMTAVVEELATVKEQLGQKSSLLDKVKVLLHRAAAREKQLVREIAELKNQNENQDIPEESEEDISGEPTKENE